MPEENKIKKGDPQVDIDTSGPDVDINLPEEKEEPKLPKPTGWRMIVLPFKMKDKTKGGLVLAETTLERQQVASQVGLVLAMGPDCYKDKERYPKGPWCKVNDWVMFARYAGSRIKIDGGEMRLLNDKEHNEGTVIDINTKQ